MRSRNIFYVATGGTIGSAPHIQSYRDVDSTAQDHILAQLRTIPFTQYQPVSVRMNGDSSDHPRKDLLDLGNTALQYAGEKDGIIVSHGTDTMNLHAAALALMGNELWRYPVVFLGSVYGPEKRGSDAPINTLTAGIFAAYGDGSGIFAVRPNGIVVTNRHDTPSGSIDWHSRVAPKEFHGSRSFQSFLNDLEEEVLRHEQRKGGYFARVRLEKILVDGVVTFAKPRKRESALPMLRDTDTITYQRKALDGTLDYADQINVGGRGRVPLLDVPGYDLALQELYHQWDFEREEPLQDLSQTIKALVEQKIAQKKATGKVIPYVAILENISRSRKKGSRLHLQWEKTFDDLFAGDLHYSSAMVAAVKSFWREYSGRKNNNLNFDQIITIKGGNTDPVYLEEIVQKVPPQGMIIQATGQAGLRMKDPIDSYRAILHACRDAAIPVVLVSSSRGEVTGLEYGPNYQLFKDDLVFFGGTFDSDLVEPRLALLNDPKNRRFLEKLVATVPGTAGQQRDLTRTIHRQLLSGSHYRKGEGDEKTDRRLIEEKYGTETRVDLLSGMHVKKAILASFLHILAQKEMPVPLEIIPVLSSA